jgi:pantetheine-phosphate adenylyltransferase
MNQQTAIYAGTFAPITLGHLDIIEQAAKLFNTLTIAVSPYHRDDLALSQEQRIALIQAATAHLKNIEIQPLSGSLASFAKATHTKWLIRGLRNAQDYAQEQSMAAMNQVLNPALHIIFLQAKPTHQAIQATLVRQLMLCKEDISAFVPKAVADWYKDLFKI